MSKIEIKGLVKYYGDYCAVDHVSFNFSSGKITALCGRNGSGKTTTIRCLLGLLKENEGEFFVDGVKRKLDLKKIGYLAEERGLFIKEEIGFQLEYFAKLKGMNKKDASRSIEYWLKRFGMEKFIDKKLESLSKGNQQKIQIVVALIHNPEVIILDEPFSGLDPVNMQLILELIKGLREEGKCILVSSHQLALIEGICEDIHIINQGHCVYSGSLIDLKRQYGSNYMYFSTKSDIKGIVAEQYAPHNYRIKLKNRSDFTDKLEKLIAKKIDIESIECKELNLQEIFVKMVGDNDNKEDKGGIE